jgi:shikimate dehydrogenase
VPDLVIANRSLEKGQSLVRDLQSALPGRKIQAIPLEEIERVIKDRTLLVQTTSIGMSPKVSESPIRKNLLHKNLLISDLIYNPLKTQIQKDGEEIGCRTHSGVGMFIYQGALSFEYWTNHQAPIEEMRKVVMSKLEMR